MSLFDDNQDDTDFMKELTGPGGKFDRSKYQSDQEMHKDIAKGKYHADKTLTAKLQEHDQLREDYLQLRSQSTTQNNSAVTEAKLQELLERLETRNNPPITDGGNQQPIDLDKIEERATQRALAAIEAREVQKKDAENLAVVDSRLRQRFGDNAKQVLRERMNSLGLTNEDIQIIAKKSPEAVMNVLGLNQQQSPVQNPPGSNIRSDNFRPSVDIRDAVYYEKLRKEKPQEYYSELTSVQRLKDMDHPDFLKRFEEQSGTSFY
jgi:hypothetical protein